MNNKVAFSNTDTIISVLKNVLNDHLGYSEELEQIFGDDNFLQFIQPYQKQSAIHIFITLLIHRLIDEETDLHISENRNQTLDKKLPIEVALVENKLEHESFKDYVNDFNLASTQFEDAALDYMNDLYLSSSAYQDLVSSLTEKVFLKVFEERDILKMFNQTVAKYMRKYFESNRIPEYEKKFFTSFTTLKCVEIPTEVKELVFQRDKKNCPNNATNRDNTEYKFLVPLEQHGLNDITNLELNCNENFSLNLY
ncbi:hypothetical protein [Hydrogenovibrio sp. JE_KL2]|uniref:hypothetical protein n=1 Tax=Hydrogenovibrio sp. JE_KL2 TaxID=2651188 RepID=UPI00128C6216|nr:hypothetical protein [Hydrogenovibrio sp. JE_KL2]MPQ76833.1 hypothetical protein [Hydrogenovibrio sp. JE_KL2]